MLACSRRRVLPRTGQAIAGVNKTIKYVPKPGSLDRFGQAMNWFFVGMLILGGAVYFINGIRFDTTDAGGFLGIACSVGSCLQCTGTGQGGQTHARQATAPVSQCQRTAIHAGAQLSGLSAGLGTLTLGLVLTVQTTYVFSQLPGAPVFYKQFAEHLAWSSGNAGCAPHSAVRPQLAHCRLLPLSLEEYAFLYAGLEDGPRRPEHAVQRSQWRRIVMFTCGASDGQRVTRRHGH